jgi:REP element-mobilizing transposase RayT
LAAADSGRLARGSGSRSLPAGHSFLITLCCNSRQFLIAKRIRRDVLLVVLEKAKQNYAFRLYGICLMANHIHLLIKPDDASQLPKLMHWVKTTNGP